MTVLIDGDILCYRAASATDGKLYKYRGQSYETIKEMEQLYSPDFRRDAVETVYEPEPWSHAKRIIDNLMEDYVFAKTYVGGNANFRYKVATIKEYKGNRVGVRRPMHLDAAKQYLCEEYEARRPMGPWETDDQISLEIEEGDTLVSIDKDFLQIPGIKLKDTISLKEVETNEVSALASLYAQALTGDTADNIPGCYGCGKKAVSVKKVKEAESEEEMFDIVLTEYKKRYHSYAEQFMCENLKLLYLLRGSQLAWVSWLGADTFYEQLLEGQ